MPCNYDIFTTADSTAVYFTSFIIKWTVTWQSICLSGFVSRDAIGPGHFHITETLQNHQKCPGALQRTSKDVLLLLFSVNVYLYPYLTSFSSPNRCHSAMTSFSTWLRMELNCCLMPAIRDWKWETTCVCALFLTPVTLLCISIVFAGNWSVRFEQSETEILVSDLMFCHNNCGLHLCFTIFLDVVDADILTSTTNHFVSHRNIKWPIPLFITVEYILTLRQ